jgi:hypothetical protein
MGVMDETRLEAGTARREGEDMSMSRGLQVLGRGFAGLWPFGGAQPQLMIDMRRVNIELRKEALAELENDVAYRDRVKQRMREGSRCAHPPLIDRKKVLHFAARPGATGLSAGNGETVSGSLAQAG